ncbi:MAG: hypothetical protein ACI4ME_06775 [Aristaeellaceae bacterium]
MKYTANLQELWDAGMEDINGENKTVSNDDKRKEAPFPVDNVRGAQRPRGKEVPDGMLTLKQDNVNRKMQKVDTENSRHCEHKKDDVTANSLMQAGMNGNAAQQQTNVVKGSVAQFTEDVNRKNQEQFSARDQSDEGTMRKIVTETKAFKRWFGKSKIVNVDGTPMYLANWWATTENQSWSRL